MKNFDRRTLVKSLATATLTTLAPQGRAMNRPLPHELETEVCILGAGAAGMFAAMHLRDLGYKVLVVEKENRVGGHAQSYRDLESGVQTEMGVRSYPDIPIIRQTFQKYGIALKEISQAGSKRAFVNFESGQASSYIMPSANEISDALQRFNAIRDEDYDFLNRPGINPPSPVPSELLSSFKDFLNENDISAIFPAVASQLMGRGKALEIPTFYALKALRKDIVQSAMNDGFVRAETGADSIYKIMAEQLGEDIILSARIQLVQRAEEALISITRNDGATTLIKANKMIVAFPPSQSNLSSFDLDKKESRLFGEFTNKYYWSTLVRTEGLQPDILLMNNKGPNPDDNRTFADQVYPGIFIIAPTAVPGLTNVLYGSDRELTEEQIKVRITGDLEKLSGEFVDGPVKVLGFDAFVSHSPYSPMASNFAIGFGFYRDLNKLQGYRGTYYLGAAFDSNDTSSVWLHAKGIVEQNFPSKQS